MAILLNADGKIDNPSSVSDKVLDEQTYRRNILTMARDIGCLREVMLVFKKYDELMRLCNNPAERKQIGQLGIVELHNILNPSEPLVIDGQVVIK